MILAHVTTVPMSLGFLRGQVEYMQRQGLIVDAISSPGPMLDSFGMVHQVRTFSVEMPRRISPCDDTVAVGKLVRHFMKTGPTIVHAHTPKGGLLGMISAWLVRTPVRIYHMRGLPYMSANGRRRRVLMMTERTACRLAHRVICVSHSLRDVAIRDGICPPDKITVIGGGSGNGVDAERRFNPSRFSESHRQDAREQMGIPSYVPAIGFIGRVVRDKGVHELAAAWSVLRVRYPNAHLILVGPVEPQDPVDPQVLSVLERDDRVHLLGMVQDTSELYPAFDVVVLPTYREGFPNVPLEASAMELPVVATAIPGCIDAVEDGVTGTLIRARDANALEGAIAQYLDEPGLRMRHGKAGRERVLREFRQEVIWQGIYDEYGRLLRERGIEPPGNRREARAF